MKYNILINNTWVALLLFCITSSGIAMEKEMPIAEKIYRIVNHTGNPLHVRVRINDKVYRPYADKYDYDILGNSEVFKLNNNQALFIPQADIQFPLNIRVWPGTYEPKVALDVQGKNLPTSKEDTENSLAITAANLDALNTQAGPNGNLELLKGSIPNRLAVQATSVTPSYETSKNVPILKPKQPSQIPSKIPGFRSPDIPINIPGIKPVYQPEIPAIKPAYKPVSGIAPKATEYVAPYIPRMDIQYRILEEEGKQLERQNGYLIEKLKINESSDWESPTQQETRYTLFKNSFGPLYVRIELGNYVFKPLDFTFNNSHNVFLFEKGKNLTFDSNLLAKYGPFKIYFWTPDMLDFISKDIDASGKPIPTSNESKGIVNGRMEAENKRILRGDYNAYDLVNDHGFLLIKPSDLERP